MSFTGRSKFTNDIKERKSEIWKCGTVKNKNETLDIYDDSDLEINNEIE